MLLKRLLRKVILGTAVPPMLHVYRGYYSFVTMLALRMFRRFPEVKAVYLRRGGGSGNIFPLISDLDFGLFVSELGEERRHELAERYKRLGRWTTVLDHFLEIYDVRTFSSLYGRSRRQYRYTEGRATWKLIYGEPYMNTLPDLPLDQIQHGLFRELTIWWTVFVWRQIQKGRYYEEPKTRNSLCFKATAEILKMELGLLHGRLIFDKTEALAQSIPFLDTEEGAHVAKVREIGRRHYRGGSASLPDETVHFLMKRLDRFASLFQGHPLCQSMPELALRIEDPPGEREIHGVLAARIHRVLECVKSEWGNTYRGAALVTGFYFNVGERALLLSVDPARLPTIDQLRLLYERHLTETSPLDANGSESWEETPLQLYVLMRRVALQIDVDFYNRGWQSLLLPEGNPDVFTLLSQKEYWIDGAPDPASVSSEPRDSGAPVFPWTLLANKVMSEELDENRELLQRVDETKVLSDGGSKAAWNVLRYQVMRAAIATGEAHVPLTKEAVLRAAVKYGYGPLVTVLMPCRDAAPALFRAAVQSVQSQVDAAWKLIVIDDGSKDPGTLSALESLRRSLDPRIEVVESEGRMVTGAINTGIRLADTPFVCMLHCDDLLDPNAIAVLRSAIAEYSDVDYFHSSRVHIDEHGQRIGEPHRARESFALDDFKKFGPVKHLHCWRVSAALAAGGMDEALGPHGADDYDFPWTMAEAGARFHALRECLYYYRDRGSQKRLTTHVSLETQVRELIKIFRKHGMSEQEIEEQIAIRSADYLRQALYKKDDDVPAAAADAASGVN